MQQSAVRDIREHPSGRRVVLNVLEELQRFLRILFSLRRAPFEPADLAEIPEHDGETPFVAELSNDGHGQIVQAAAFVHIDVDIDCNCGQAEHRSRNALTILNLFEEFARLAIFARCRRSVVTLVQRRAGEIVSPRQTQPVAVALA